MGFTKSGTILAVLAIVVAASVVAAGLYIFWPNNPPPEKNDKLFSTPIISINDSVSSYDSFKGATTYLDAGSAATTFEAGTSYWFDIKSTPTDKAKEMLKSNDSSFFGWIWCIEVQSASGSAPDLNLWYYTYYIKYGGYVDASWNTTSVGKAVGLAGIAPNRDITMGLPLWVHADGFTVADTHGWLNFTKPGDYTIKAYLVNASDGWLVPSTAAVPLNLVSSAASPIGQVKIQEMSNATGCQYFTTPSLALYHGTPSYPTMPSSHDGYLSNGVPTTDLYTNVTYVLTTEAIPTDCARQFLNTEEHNTSYKNQEWIWVIEVDKPGIKASDVHVHTAMQVNFIYFQEDRWNASQPDKLICLAYTEPMVSSRYSSNLYPYDWYTKTGSTDNNIVFNTPGDYTIKAYLINYHDVNVDGDYPLGYGSAPRLDAFNISSPIGEKQVTVVDRNSNLFTAPTLTVNESVAQYSSFYSKTLYEDNHTNGPMYLSASTPYWFEFRSTIIGDEAGKRLESNGQNPTGWVWAIVIEKQDIKASDVWVEFRMDSKFPNMRTTIAWNDSEPGKLVGLVNLAPDRFYSETPAIEWANNFDGDIVAHGVIQFNMTGPYLISTYLVPLSSVQNYSPIGGAPIFLDGQIASSVSSATRWVL